MPMTMGKTGGRASSSWFRRRPKTSRSSATKNRNQVRAGLREAVTAGAGPARMRRSAGDIEALTGEADEQVLQAGRGHGVAADPDAGVHQLRADPLPLGVAQQ